MSTKRRLEELRRAFIDAIGITINPEELGLLAGRLRFDKTPAMSQQEVAGELGRSQPYISNLERELVRKLKDVAARRQDQASRTEGMHDALDTITEQVATIKRGLPPRPLKVPKFG